MSIHLTIKNENRDAQVKYFSLVLVAGGMICFVVKSENYLLEWGL